MVFTARRFSPPAPEPPSMPVGTLDRRTVELTGGQVAYLRHGAGPPLLLVHGIPTSARLWEPLLGDLGRHFDCIAPDLLGLGRSLPRPGARLDSPGQADMLAELLDALGIGETLLALHDQGGAHGQQFLVRHPERVRAVAFTNEVCFDNWPVPVITMLMAMSRSPRLVGALGRAGIMQMSLDAYTLPQTVRRMRTVPRALRDDWMWAVGPDATPGALEGFCAYVAAQSPRWTMEAVPTLAAWSKPATVIWTTDDAYLPVHWGVRLAETVPTADPRPTLIPSAGHFFHAEVPQTAARVLLDFFGPFG